MDKFSINTQVADLIDGLMNLPMVDTNVDTKVMEREGMKKADDEEALALWRIEGCVNMAIINTDDKEKKEVVEPVVFMPQYSRKPLKVAVSIAKDAKIDAPTVREELINVMGQSGTDIKAGYNDSRVSYAYSFGHKAPKSMIDKIDGMMTNIKNNVVTDEEDEIDFSGISRNTTSLFGSVQTKPKKSTGSPFGAKGSPFGGAKLSSKR